MHRTLIFCIFCSLFTWIQVFVFGESVSSKGDVLYWALTRYKLKYSPEANLIVATLPGPVTANIEAPYGWPMPGFALRLNSLVPSAKAHYLGSVDMLQQCVVNPLRLQEQFYFNPALLRFETNFLNDLTYTTNSLTYVTSVWLGYRFQLRNVNPHLCRS